MTDHFAAIDAPAVALGLEPIRIDPIVPRDPTGGDNEGFYIRTFTGKKFHFSHIAEAEFDIRDIAHALAMNCRWTGHVREFYSVAQHSVYAAMMAPQPLKISALLHDGSEAYVHDTPSPLKWHLKEKGFNTFADLENEIDHAIFKAFKLPWPRDPKIKQIDLRLLATEHRDLMPSENEEYKYMVPPYDWHVEPWGPVYAEKVFLDMFNMYRQVGG